MQPAKHTLGGSYTSHFFALFIFREKAKKIFNSLRKKRKMRKSILLVNIPQKFFLKISKLFKKKNCCILWENVSFLPAVSTFPCSKNFKCLKIAYFSFQKLEKCHFLVEFFFRFLHPYFSRKILLQENAKKNFLRKKVECIVPSKYHLSCDVSCIY